MSPPPDWTNSPPTPISSRICIQLVLARRAYLADRSWFADAPAGEAPLTAWRTSAWSSASASALPLYAGGLGVLAGDFLKAASDQGMPVIGIGLLYQEGYFHQMIDAEGRQFEAFPYNDPSSMPVEPARTADGAWLHIPVELPGRTLRAACLARRRRADVAVFARHQ